MATYADTLTALKTKFESFIVAAGNGAESKTAALQARKLSMELRADLQDFRKVSVSNDQANTKHRAPKAEAPAPVAS